MHLALAARNTTGAHDLLSIVFPSMWSLVRTACCQTTLLPITCGPKFLCWTTCPHTACQIVVQPGNSNGVKVDGCFYQHGEFHQAWEPRWLLLLQLFSSAALTPALVRRSPVQGGSYGAEFSGYALYMIALSRSTRYAINSQAADVLSTYLVDGQQARDAAGGSSRLTLQLRVSCVFALLLHCTL